MKETFKFRIKINGHKIIPTTNIKYLGIYLDDDLSGMQHCKALEGKLIRANGMLCKVRHNVSHDELIAIYHAIFSSHLSYNCQVLIIIFSCWEGRSRFLKMESS